MPEPLDPRPLTGEPLALDLINTTWVDDAGAYDLLDDPARAQAWLAHWELSESASPAGQRTLVNLRATRAAVRAVLEHPTDAAGCAAFDTVLARGRLRLSFDAGRPGEQVEVPDAWRASWLAARDLLRLLDRRPHRIKPCANPDCVLWFDDTTRSATRRWCSMTGGCGSRLKARRHQERQRTRADAVDG